MQVYTVHEPPNPPADVLDRAAEVVLVRDGFSVIAAAAAPVWMLVRGLWLALGAYIVVSGVLFVIVWLSGVHAAWASLLIQALNIIVGFEAGSIRRWTLERKGWQLVGTVSGRSREDCERRFFESWLEGGSGAQPGRLASFGAGMGSLAGRFGGGGAGASFVPRLRSMMSRL